LDNAAIMSVAKKVLGAHIAKPQVASANKTAVQHDHNMALIIGAGMLLLGVTLGVLDALRTRKTA
jgi:hypothetical protein